MSNPKSPQDLFSQLAELAPEEREPILERECGHDPALRERVEALLLAHDSPDSFLDKAVDAFGGTYVPEPGSTGEYRLQLQEGMEIADRYTLRELIGEGGMGEVWVAKQTDPVKRKVALKLIKTGMDSKAVLARFEQERQALAIMDHPNIAKVLDAGLIPSGQPFFIMELVNGLPLDKFCDQARLTAR